jgi:hypothetical protein
VKKFCSPGGVEEGPAWGCPVTEGLDTGVDIFGFFFESLPTAGDVLLEGLFL